MGSSRELSMAHGRLWRQPVRGHVPYSNACDAGACALGPQIAKLLWVWRVRGAGPLGPRQGNAVQINGWLGASGAITVIVLRAWVESGERGGSSRVFSLRTDTIGQTRLRCTLCLVHGDTWTVAVLTRLGGTHRSVLLALDIRAHLLTAACGYAHEFASLTLCQGV